jgi:hypothetical protein
LILLGLLKKKNECLQMLVKQSIESICLNLIGKFGDKQQQITLFNALLNNFLDTALQEATSPKYYFELMSVLLVRFLLLYEKFIII